MPFTLAGRTVQRIGVIGSGNVGPDIALFFSRALSRHGVPVVVHDIDPQALESGRDRVLRKLRKGGESGVFRPAEAETILKNITFTLDKSLLVGCCFVVEAVPENLRTKQEVFEELEAIAPPHGILASTSSHLEPERLFERLRRPERALVHHFFFPAERNPLVELVPGPKTQVADWCRAFYEALGKVPIRARGRWGYAINPVFEGLLLAAMLVEQNGLAPGIVDAITCRALKTTAGPFTLLNLTGGNSACRLGFEGYHEKVMPWFQVPPSLDERLATRTPWRTTDKGETVSYSNSMFEEVSRMLLGAYFGLACEVLESGIATLSDLELGVELGLALAPPFALMNELGPRKVRSLVETYARAHPGFKMPASFGPWEIPVVLREDRDGVAVLTIRRPRALNALGPETFRQIGAQLAAVAKDPAVRGAVITGFGVKAFSSGADLAQLAAGRTPAEAAAIVRDCQRVTRLIEQLGKPVVAALNGLSLGAGSEIAYACTARIAKKGLLIAFGQPEMKLGLIPGAGATQRLPRLIGFEAAWRLLRTGGSLSGPEALRLGLLREEVDGDVVERARRLALELAPAALPAPPAVPASPPEVDLQGLSRKVDEILRRAILEGAAVDIDAGLEIEARAFAEVWATRDRQIGIDNFLRTQLKHPAPFIHG